MRQETLIVLFGWGPNIHIHPSDIDPIKSATEPFTGD